MVETSLFDSQADPPLVAATPWNEGDSFNSMAFDPPIQLAGVPVMPLEDEEDPEQDKRYALMIGAGVAAGTFGLLLGGPILAALFGFGTAYATKQDGAAGDTARAVGQVALEAKEKARELDQKHHLVQKGQDAASDAWEKAKALDRKHNILEKGKAFVLWSWVSIQEQNRKHHLMERAVDAVGRFLTYVAVKIQDRIQDGAETTRQPPHDATREQAPVQPIAQYQVEQTPPPYRVVIN